MGLPPLCPCKPPTPEKTMSDESKENMTVEGHIAELEAEINHRQNFGAPGNYEDDPAVEAEWEAAKSEHSLLKLLRELQASRELLAKAEWVTHEETEYHLEQDVCPWCGGLGPASYARVDSWNRYIYHEGHKPDCAFLALKGADRED